MKSSRSGAALVVTLSLLILLTICILAFTAIVRSDRQSAGLTAATTRAEILGRSVGNLVLSDLISEIRDGSTNIGTAAAISYRPTTNLNMRPYRHLAESSMATDTNFANLYKQSVPGSLYPATNFLSSGAARASSIGSWEPSRNARVLSRERWNKPVLLFGNGFTNTNQLPRWVYMTRRETCSASLLNPTNWTPALANSSATNADAVIGRAAYNVYEIGGCLDVNVAGGVAGATKQQLLASLAGASFTNIPGVASVAPVVQWRNASSGATATNFVGYAATNGLKAGFLAKPPGDRRFLGRQDLIAYAQNSTSSGFATNALPYLTHYTRGLDRPSAQATTATNVLSGYPARPSGANPPPLSVRWPSDVTLPDGTKLNAGDPVAFRRFPLRRLALLTDTASAVQNNSDPIYRKFGLYRSSDTGPWIYDHGANNRILTLDEVKSLNREPDFFEMLQAAINSGSLGGSAGPYKSKYAVDTEGLDENVYRQILQIGANLIDQYDDKDIPTEIQFRDAGNNVISVYGVENLPYLNEISTLPYRPAAQPRTIVRNYLQFEVWNPHQNAASADSALKLRVAVTKGKLGLGLKQGSTSSDPSGRALFDPQYNQVLAARYGKTVAELESYDYYFKPGSPLTADGAIDFSASPGYLEFQNSPRLREPNTLTSPSDPLVNPPGYPRPFAHPVLSSTGNSQHSVVNETTSDSVPLPNQSWGNPNPSAYKLDLATDVRFAGIMTAEREVPDDRADGVPDRTSFGIPAETCWQVYTTAIIGSVADNALTIELQVETPQGWKTYQKLQNLRSLTTNNRISSYQSMGSLNAQRAGNASFIRPVTFARPDRNAVPQLTLFAGNNTAMAIDPRTMRFGLILADQLGTDSEGNHEKDVTNYRIDGNGSDWMPDIIVNTDENFGALAINIPDHASGQQYYKDPDGIVRRADGEERPGVLASDQVNPMKSGYARTSPYDALGNFADRPVILNRPFESVGEMGYAFRDVPWKSLDLWTATSGDTALLDYFCVEETALDENRRPLRAGAFNPNTATAPAVEAVVRDALARELSGSPGGNLTPTQAGAIAAALQSALKASPITSVADLPRLSDGKEFPSSGAKIMRKTEKEAFVRALAPVAEPNVWNVLIDVIAQSGKFAPNASDLKDFVVQGEARYWIFASIDRTTGNIFDMQYELVTE